MDELALIDLANNTVVGQVYMILNWFCSALTADIVLANKAQFFAAFDARFPIFDLLDEIGLSCVAGTQTRYV